MRRIYEKKDHLIRRNPNLTDGEKQEIIELLGKHPSYENKIDWTKNKSLTYEDFMSVLRPLYINDLDPRGLVKGEDYDILYESDKEVLYSVHTYDASKILASNSVEPEIWTKIPDWCGDEEFTDEAHAFGHYDSEHGDMKPGAKWCISMQTSNRYWNNYSSEFHFFFWFRNNNRLRNNRKIAICVSKITWKIAELYNGADNKIWGELPSYITEAINKEKEKLKKKKLEQKRNEFLSKFILNPQTNRYDYDGNLINTILENFISEDKKGFIINFGKITGTFDCSRLDLISLKGAPQEVGGSFKCWGNKLTSLEGSPRTVGGDFSCQDNQLTSLEGAPKEVGGSFECHYNQLTSLEGAPQTIGESFYCFDNQLTSLKGAPQTVKKNFYCSYNHLTSLEGAPQTVGGGFKCSKNKLSSLEGAPQIVNEYFYCSENQLTSLKGAPRKVGGDFWCTYNWLTSLEGAPQIVYGNFYCSKNNLTSLNGIGKVTGKIYKDF